MYLSLISIGSAKGGSMVSSSSSIFSILPEMTSPLFMRTTSPCMGNASSQSPRVASPRRGARRGLPPALRTDGGLLAQPALPELVAEHESHGPDEQADDALRDEASDRAEEDHDDGHVEAAAHQQRLQ